MKINKILAGAFVALSLLSCNRELETEYAKLISEEKNPDYAADITTTKLDKATTIPTKSFGIHFILKSLISIV